MATPRPIGEQLDLAKLVGRLEPPGPMPVIAPNVGAHTAQNTADLADLAKANLASEFFATLGTWIKSFDESLNQDEETGIRLVSFGQTVTFHVERIDYDNPSLIVFHGTTAEGQKVTLIQHVTQISFLLIAMKKPDPNAPRRPFGFAQS